MSANSFIRQNAEFAALRELADHYHRITLTAIVDNDYPEVRHGYETAIKAFLEACVANGRAVK